MDTEPQESLARAKPPAAARFRWPPLLFWLPACGVHGALVASAAVLVEPFWAPVLLFSLLVGAVLGMTLVGMIRVCQVGHRSTILSGTVLAVLIAVVGQHYAGYRIAHREAVDDARMYQLAKLAYKDAVLGEMPVPPAGFVGFLRWRAARGMALWGYDVRGPLVWILWALDGLIVLATTLALLVPALRKPYCDRCRGWFGTTRRGPIDTATARRLAAIVETKLPDKLASARYRLFNCPGGCGPTGFELRWEEPRGKLSSASVWLEVEQRNLVVETLDAGVFQR